MTQKTVLITGCSSGLGLALAQACCRRGYRVLATARRPENIPFQHDNLITAKLDVTSAADIARLLETVDQDCSGGIDYLINNAGYGLMGPIMEMPIDRVREQLETNTLAPLALAQALLPGMLKRGGGTIVNIGSVSGRLITPFAGSYCSSKAALHALNDAMRRELAPFNIRVMCIAAGGITSEFGTRASQELINVLKEDSLYQTVAEKIRERAALSQKNGASALQVAEDIVDAMEKTPRRPYVLVASGARLLSWIARLPQTLQDKILNRRFGLNRITSRR